ncbi:MAG: hypothetical protein FWG91_03780 [Lachnospiraceae bacterium]|nr:hypothetical protein [Lachnospiraceae bacterium]
MDGRFLTDGIFLTAKAWTYGAETIWMLIIILQGICFSGGIARVLYCMIQLAHDEEDAAQNKKRAKHAVIFIILATGALQIVNAILSYFGGPRLSG